SPREDDERVDAPRVGNEARLSTHEPATARASCLERCPACARRGPERSGLMRRERRGQRTGGDPRQEVGRAGQRRQGERDGREVRARVERAAKLLEHDRLFDEAEAGTTLRLGDRRAGPSKAGELWPGRAVPAILRRRDLREARKGVTLLEERASLRAELVLLPREAEVHQRLRGN